MSKAQGIAQSANQGQFKNKIINGDFRVWQRGTSTSGITGNGTFVADRFQTSYGGGSPAGSFTYSRTSDAPTGFMYSARIEHASASTAPNEYVLRQFIEMQNVRDLFGSSITVSFWYKSNRTGNHATRFSHNNITGASSSDVSFVVNAANTWEYKTITFTNLLSATGTSTADNAWGIHLDIGFRTNAIGLSSIAAGDYYQVTGVQLEKGSTATSFDYRPYGTELALCQRYFQTYSGGLFGVVYSSSAASFGQAFPVVMRAAPSSSLTAAATIDQLGVALRTQSSASVTNSGNAVTPEAFNVFMTNFSSMTLGYPVALLTTGGKLQFSAEL